MIFQSKFNVGDLLTHVFSTSEYVDKAEIWSDKRTVRAFQVSEITTHTCYAGTQIHYKCRPLHVEFRVKRNDDKTTTREYLTTEPGWAGNGEMTVVLREDELKILPDNIKNEILGTIPPLLNP